RSLARPKYLASGFREGWAALYNIGESACRSLTLQRGAVLVALGAGDFLALVVEHFGHPLPVRRPRPSPAIDHRVRTPSRRSDGERARVAVRSSWARPARECGTP